MTASPLVTVIVVNYRSPWLGRCLQALAGQTFADFEAVIVDCASGDGSFAAARATVDDQRFAFHALERNLGFAAGNNWAAARARGEWLALLNPDAFARPDWLEALVAATRRHPGVDMFASLQLDAENPTVADGLGDCYHAFGFTWRGGHGRPVPPGLGPAEVFAACGAAALYRHSGFLALGGFEERFFCYHEDSDLAFRWRLVGGRCVFVPEAVVEHVGGGSSDSGSGFARFHGARNSLWCFLRNMPGLLLITCLPGHLLVQAALLIRDVTRGGGTSGLRGLMAGVAGAPEMLASRVRIRRRLGWGAVAAMLTWNPLPAARRMPCHRPLL